MANETNERLEMGDWARVASLLMIKNRTEEVLITTSDLERLERASKNTIVLTECATCLRVRMVTSAEASRIASNFLEERKS